jgi:transposase-like protein
VLFNDERVTDVAEELQVSKSTLYSWVREAKNDKGLNDDLIICALKQKLQVATEERDTLMKALVIFAKELN